VNIRRAVSVTTLIAALLASGSIADAASPAAPEPPSPATGHSEVIAQGVVGFDAAAYRWSLGSHPVPAEGGDFTAAGGTFLALTSGPAVTVHGAEGTWSRLAAGEATFRFSGSTASTASSAAATLTTIGLDVATDGGADAFTPGAGTHDMELLRDVLATGETFTLTSELPALVLVTSGSITDAAGAGLSSGASSNFTGTIALTNSASDPATILVAVIGPVLSPAQGTAPTTTVAGTPTTAPSGPGTTQPSGPGTTQPSGPGTTQPSGPDTTQAPPTTLDPMGDADGDGLLNGDETGVWNTNPNDADSDNDGYSDYSEVIDFQTNPNNPNDKPSVPTTTEPPPDADGDGLTDAEEAQLGTNPNNQDTDGDTYADGGEVLSGTDPLDPNDPDNG
jgi:hypothetical protein